MMISKGIWKSNNLYKHRSATASYIIEIIRAAAANGDFLHNVGVPNRWKANRYTPPKFRQKANGAYNLRLCKMLSLQRAKPFCANAFQPPVQL